MKKITILLVLALFGLSANSQIITFQKTFGGSDADEASCVQQTSDGGYIITGVTQSGIIGSNQDVVLIKTDSIGNMIWNKTYGGTDNEKGTCVQQTSDGGYIIAGSYYFGSGPQYRGILIRTNLNGDTVWTKIYGDSDNIFSSIIQTSDGCYIVGGTLSSGLSNGYLLKLDSMGNIIWEKRIGGLIQSQSINIYEVQETSDNGYVAVGCAFGVTQTYLLKLNSNGDTLWSRTYPSGYANSIQQTIDNGYIIIGLVTSSPNRKACFTKVDSIGNIIWNKSYGLNGINLESFCIRQTNNGDYVALLSDLSSQPIYVVRINSLGSFIWGKKYQSGTNGDLSYCVQQTSDEGFIFCGWRQASASSNTRDIYLTKTDLNGVSGCNETPYLFSVTDNVDPILNLSYPFVSESNTSNSFSVYTNSLSLIETTLCTTVGVNNIADKNTISIYPNPVSGILNLEYQSDKTASPVGLASGLWPRERIEIEIINLLSQKVLEKTFETVSGGNIITLEVDQIPSGVYLLQVKSKDSIFTKKIIKE